MSVTWSMPRFDHRENSDHFGTSVTHGSIILQGHGGDADDRRALRRVAVVGPIRCLRFPPALFVQCGRIRKHCAVRQDLSGNYRTRTISRTLYSTPSGSVRPALLVRLISMIRGSPSSRKGRSSSFPMYCLTFGPAEPSPSMAPST